MGGNPQEILAALSDKRRLEPSGEPSLQNGLTMAKGGMAYVQNIYLSDGPDDQTLALDIITRDSDSLLSNLDCRPRRTCFNTRYPKHARS